MTDPISDVVPPDAPQVPYCRVFHGDSVQDPYHWMSDKSDPRLLAYLAEENAFTDAVTADQAPLREQLYRDISVRTKQTDLSVPLFVTHRGGDSFWYYSRSTEGLDYARHCRLPAHDRDAIPDVTDPVKAVIAFQRRFRPDLIDGIIDGECRAKLLALLLPRPQ